MDITYDVRVWETEVYKGKTGTSYYVRWRVSGRRWREPFKQKALAESFRSDVVAAARKGEAFDIATGRPVSMARQRSEVTWYAFACEFVDMKWPRVAATTRRTRAEALTAVTALMFTIDRGRPDGRLLRHALCRWAFNTSRRKDPRCPTEVREALRWAESHSRPVSTLHAPTCSGRFSTVSRCDWTARQPPLAS